MQRALPLILAFAVSGCSDVVKTEGLGDLPVDDIAFSDAYRDSVGLSNGNTLSLTTVVLSDREDLCEAVDGVGLDGLDDVFAVQLTALTTGNPSGITSDSSFGDLLGTSPQFRQFVGARVIERSGGVTVFDGRSTNLLDLFAVSEGSLGVSSSSSSPNGYRIGGSFSADIGADLTDGTTFDVDVNDDGVSDFARLNGSIKGRFTGARGCDALATALQGDGGGGGGGGQGCDDERFDNPNPGGEAILNVEFGDVCDGATDSMTYNVDTGCTTRLDVTVPDAFDDNGNQVREVRVSLSYAGGGGGSPTDHTIRDVREFNDQRVYLENGGDSFGAVTVRIEHVRGADPVPYTLNTVVDCPQ